MNQHIILVNGKPRAGKDTFMDALIEFAIANGLSAEKFSIVDEVKQIAKTMGWKGGKSASERKFLSELMDLHDKYYDGPMTYALNKALNSNANIVITTMRSPHHIQAFVESMHILGKHVHTVCIIRPEFEHNNNNHADANVMDFEYANYIKNDGSIDEYKEKAEDYFDSLFDAPTDKAATII